MLEPSLGLLQARQLRALRAAATLLSSSQPRAAARRESQASFVSRAHLLAGLVRIKRPSMKGGSGDMAGHSVG